MIPSFGQKNFLKIDNVIPVFILVASLFTVLSIGIIYYSSITSKTYELSSITTRMHDNIRFKNESWDLAYLNSDPILPGSNPHYIITSDGYVIERWRPIKGYLDTSNFSYMIQFKTPQTVVTPAQESWRVLSKAVLSGKETIGVVHVARFIGEGDNVEVIDKRLQDDLTFVVDKIKVRGETIDASALDFRQTRYDISIKIVDKYNEVIAKTNNSNSIDRVPNYIDPSYVAEELNHLGTRIIRNETTGEPFLIMSSAIQNNDAPVGLLVSAISLNDLYFLLRTYGIVMLILGTITTIILKIAVENYRMNKKPTSIRFYPENLALYINDKRIIFPEDSHQSHILTLLFKNPEKSWSAEQITHAFDEHTGNVWRRVYDAMLVINKKVEPYIGDKLIIIKDKRFLLNPSLFEAFIS